MVHVAVELAQERGLDSFTVQDVLKRADVSIQTFYRHFDSKDELLLAVLEEAVTAQASEYRRKISQLRDPIARVEYVVKAPFLGRIDRRLSPLVVREHLRLMEGYAREVRAADESYRELLREAIVDAQDAGYYKGVDPADEAELIMALVLSRYHNLLLRVATRSASSEAEHIWDFCRAALARGED
jgi:AcrR family transcriptional regulator